MAIRSGRAGVRRSDRASVGRGSRACKRGQADRRASQSSPGLASGRVRGRNPQRALARVDRGSPGDFSAASVVCRASGVRSGRVGRDGASGAAARARPDARSHPVLPRRRHRPCPTGEGPDPAAPARGLCGVRVPRPRLGPLQPWRSEVRAGPAGGRRGASLSGPRRPRSAAPGELRRRGRAGPPRGVQRSAAPLPARRHRGDRHRHGRPARRRPGCIYLAVTDPPLHLTGPLERWIQRFFGSA